MIGAINILATQCKSELLWLIAVRLCELCGLADSKFRVVAKSCEFFGFLQLTIVVSGKEWKPQRSYFGVCLRAYFGPN